MRVLFTRNSIEAGMVSTARPDALLEFGGTRPSSWENFGRVCIASSNGRCSSAPRFSCSLKVSPAHPSSGRPAAFAFVPPLRSNVKPSGKTHANARASAEFGLL